MRAAQRIVMCRHPHVIAGFSPLKVRWAGSRPLTRRAVRRGYSVVSQIYRFGLRPA